MKWFNLRNKLVIPTLALFVITLSISTRMTFRIAREALEQSANEQMIQWADSTMRGVSSWVDERRREMISWSERPLLIDAVRVVNPEPRVKQAAAAALEKAAQNARYFEIVVLADKNGTVVCSSDEEKSKGITVADRDYFRQVMGGETVISDVLRSKTSGNPVFVVATPVRIENEPAGVLLSAVDLAYFTKAFVESVKIGQSGYAIVTDQRGIICSHPDKKLVLETNITNFVFGAEMMAKKNGAMSYDYQGQSIISAYRTDPNMGWMALVRVPKDEVMAAAKSIQKINMISGAVAILVVTLFLLVLSRGVTRSIAEIAQVAHRIAQGNLAEAKQAIEKRRITKRLVQDEIDDLFASISSMTNSLSSLVGQVQVSSVQLTSTATEIAATSRQQETVVANFGSSTTQVVATVKEISATSQELSKTMQQVKDVTTTTVSLADTGRTGLAGMEETMNHLTEATESIASKLAVINDKAGSINSVITTITKVADQTNLLSLNAAIEAEKAGQYGLGFAVVAREIRRLADQTAVATLDIERSVKEMQSSVSAGVMEADKFTGEVNRGVQAVKEINHQLGSIIVHIKELAPRFEAVNDGMQAQSQGAQQISQAMVQLNDGALKTSDSLRQFKDATEQLREAARRLQTEVTQFKV
jgi:methyl-accepting chemotaxis protein WspA